MYRFLYLHLYSMSFLAILLFDFILFYYCIINVYQVVNVN